MTNRLPSATYDAAGNLTDITLYGFTYRYTYDALNKMKYLQSNGGIARVFLYDADDRRLALFDCPLNTCGAKTTSERWTVRGIDGRVLRVYSRPAASGWEWATDYVYRGSQLLAAVEPGAGNSVFALDQLGSPRQITDGNAAQMAFHAYYPYGAEATATSQDDFSMKFTGHERDKNALVLTDDLDYMMARYSAPCLGRFLSPDPVLGRPKNPRSWNRYSYALGNPTNLLDPDGKTVVSALNLIGEHAHEIKAAADATGGKVTATEIARVIFQENMNDRNLIRGNDSSALFSHGGPEVKNAGARVKFIIGLQGTWGIGEMSTETAAEVLGFDPGNLDDQQRYIIYSSLGDPDKAIPLIAGYLLNLKQQFPQATTEEILNGYNRGPANIFSPGVVYKRSGSYLSLIKIVLARALRDDEHFIVKCGPGMTFRSLCID